MKTLLIAYLIGLAGPAMGQSFDQLTRPVASLVRPSLIDTFLTELLIPPPDTLSRIDIVDLTRNGFGPDDVIILYPSQTAYPVRADVPRLLQDIMKGWELVADYRLDATLQESHTLQPEAHRLQDAKGAISGAIVSAIAQYYQGTDIDLRLARAEEGIRLEMWNYDPDAMRYRAIASGPACLSGDAQQFRFAQPRFVVAFTEPGRCVEVRQTDGQVLTTACTDGQ